MPSTRAKCGSLLRILGVVFGIAAVVGGTIGRSLEELAARLLSLQLPDGAWINDKNPAENSQFGVRFHFLAGSTEWSVNYLYQRFAPDGSPVAIVRR